MFAKVGIQLILYCNIDPFLKGILKCSSQVLLFNDNNTISVLTVLTNFALGC